MMPPITPPAVPPGTPPATPPTTPTVGGALSSFIIAISFGICLRRHQLAGIELPWDRLHHLGRRRAAGGGGGGGGGGGATRKLVSCAGLAVYPCKSTESESSTPISAVWTETTGALSRACRVLAVPSTNVCSNMVLSHLSPIARKAKLLARELLKRLRAGTASPHLLHFRCPPSHSLPRTRSTGTVASCLLPALQEILPEDQNRTRNKDRRIGPDDNTDDQRKGEAVQNLSAEKEQRNRGQEGESRGQDGPAQRLVHAAVDQSFQGLAADGSSNSRGCGRTPRWCRSSSIQPV